MNRYLRLGLVVFGLAFLMSVVSVSNTAAQGPLTEIYRRMDVQNKSIQSLKADLAMVKYDSGLQITDPPMVGSTKYLPKSKATGNKLYARIDWTKPEEQLSIIGDNYELYRPRIPQVIQGTVQKAKGGTKAANILSFMSMSREELKANYVPVYIGEEQLNDGTKTWHIQLTPRGSTSYKMADLWIDGDGFPRQTKITEQNNDTNTLFLSHVEKNIKIDTKIFKLVYPSSIKPQKV